MPKYVVVAALATLGMLSSTLALAEVTASSVTSVINAPEAPAFVAPSVATPVSVEPAKDNQFIQPTPQNALSDDIDTLAELVAVSDEDDTLDADTKCLAIAVYYEARSESLAGQLAVANVVLERSRSSRFPKNVCDVVTQPRQFSFVRGGQLPTKRVNARQWKTAEAIARIAQDDAWENPVEGALFFHATRVSPRWGKEPLTRIGGHIFYR